MLVKLDTELSFILKKDLKEFELLQSNGSYLVKTAGFKQVIKKAEYDQIIRVIKPVVDLVDEPAVEITSEHETKSKRRGRKRKEED